jgi:16S rRNA processing protein RimM
LLGVALRPFGTKGELRVNPFLSDEALSGLKNFFAAGKSYKVIATRRHKKQWLIKIDGISGPEALSALAGETLYMDRGELPELAEDEVYWSAIEGFSVVDETGVPIGRLVDYMESGSADVFIIEGEDGKEYMVSNNRDHVISIDLDAKLVTVARIGLSS